MKRCLVLVSLLLPHSSAFAPNNQGQLGRAASNTQLRESVDEKYSDDCKKMMTFADECALKVVGDVKHKPGQADAKPMDLLHYKSLVSADEAKVNGILSNCGSKIICSGKGKEFYKFPGETVEKVIELAPVEAVKDAFQGAGPAIDCDQLVFNFLGANDMIIGEVIEATNELVKMMDINTKAKISFNSLGHSSVETGTCEVTVVAVGSGEGDFTGADKAIASGELYSKDGSYYTVDEADLVKAVF